MEQINTHNGYCSVCGITINSSTAYATLQEEPYEQQNYCCFKCMIQGLLFRIKGELSSGNKGEYAHLKEHLIYLMGILLDMGSVELCREDLDECSRLLCE